MTWQYFPEVDERMDATFMERLIALREDFNTPMNVTSSFRTKKDNERVGGGEYSAHLFGRAVDIAIRGGDALKLIALAWDHGFTGVGVKQHGGGRFIHLDDMANRDVRPRPWIWSYK